MSRNDIKSASVCDSAFDTVNTHMQFPNIGPARGVFRPRQARQLPRAVDLKGRLLTCQSY